MVKYKITVVKNHNMVATHYDLEVQFGGAELIAGCSVFIDGKDVIQESAANNSKFFGAVYTKVNEDKDVQVGFSVTSNTNFSASGDDTLRAGHPYDDATFEN